MINVQFFSKLKLSNEEAELTQDEMHSDKLVSLLSFLIVNRHKSCTVAEIGSVLWEDDESINISGAAKNLAWRLRKLLRTKWPDTEFIQTVKGSYRWNPDIEVSLDCEQMMRFSKMADKTKDGEKKMNLLRKACALYQGRFLMDYDSERWIMPLSMYYHNNFLSISKKLAVLLEETGRFEEMERVLNRAVAEEALDESLWVLLIRAMTAEGKYFEAERIYHDTTNMIYNTLGIGPSDELKSAYEEKNLDVIFRDLKEPDEAAGAFYCEYGVFKKIFELEVRRQSRPGSTIHIALITMVTSGEKSTKEFSAFVEAGMMRMQNAILGSLRRGDVVTRFSSTQFLIMLPGCKYEMAERVMRRIFDSFRSRRANRKYDYTYTIKGMQIDPDMFRKDRPAGSGSDENRGEDVSGENSGGMILHNIASIGTSHEGRGDEFRHEDGSVKLNVDYTSGSERQATTEK
jgi:DNA-binding SARP family transcriptional activator